MECSLYMVACSGESYIGFSAGSCCSCVPGIANCHCRTGVMMERAQRPANDRRGAGCHRLPTNLIDTYNAQGIANLGKARWLSLDGAVTRRAGGLPVDATESRATPS